MPIATTLALLFFAGGAILGLTLSVALACVVTMVISAVFFVFLSTDKQLPGTSGDLGVLMLFGFLAILICGLWLFELISHYWLV